MKGNIYETRSLTILYLSKYNKENIWSNLIMRSVRSSGGQSTQIKYLSKSTDTYNKILLQ